ARRRRGAPSPGTAVTGAARRRRRCTTPSRLRCPGRWSGSRPRRTRVGAAAPAERSGYRIPGRTCELTLRLHLEVTLHPEQDVRVALEVVPPRLEVDEEIVGLPGHLQKVACGRQRRHAGIRVLQEVWAVDADSKREAHDVSGVCYDVGRFEIIAGAIGD